MKAILFIFACALTLSIHAQTIIPDDFQKGLTTKDAQLLDVRTTGEYKNGHIKNSLQADWNQQDQFKDRVQYVDKKKPVYIYCASGVRSNAAAKWMRENGFTNVQELKGGITAWNAEQKPTEGLPAEAPLTPDTYAGMTAKSPTVLIDFGAPWCPPCLKMEPVLASLDKDLKGKFLRINLDPTIQTALAAELKIVSLPTFLVYKNGKEIFRKQGIATYEELKTPILR